jgi:hypothetical protein
MLGTAQTTPAPRGNLLHMTEDEATEREQLLEDYVVACAEYETLSTGVATRMEDAHSGRYESPTAAEALTLERARCSLIALRRRVYQSGAQYLEGLPLG